MDGVNLTERVAEIADAGAHMYEQISDVLDKALQFAGTATLPKVFVLVYDEFPTEGNQNMFGGSTMDPRNAVALVSNGLKFMLTQAIEDRGGEAPEEEGLEDDAAEPEQ